MSPVAAVILYFCKRIYICFVSIYVNGHISSKFVFLCICIYSSGALVALHGRFFRRVSKPYYLTGVNCHGNESSLAECKHNGWNKGECPIDHEAGVQCNGGNHVASIYIIIQLPFLKGFCFLIPYSPAHKYAYSRDVIYATLTRYRAFFENI